MLLGSTYCHPPTPRTPSPEGSRYSFDSDPLARLLAQAEATFRSARAPATLRASEHN
jgi:hypothetical protein